MCARAGTDDALRPIPRESVPAVNVLFGTRMPTDMAVATTVFRCAAGQALVCTTGANLPCGKANVARKNAGASAWCSTHPNTDFVPAVATGHDTIYAWRCRQGTAEITGKAQDVDSRGFFARYWKALR